MKKQIQRFSPRAATSSLILPALLASSLFTTACVRQEKPATDPEVNLTNIKEIFNTPLSSAGPQADPNKVEIRVNGTDITFGEIVQQANIVAATQGRGMSREQLMQNRDRIVAQAKDTLILRALLTTAVANEKTEVPEADWNTQLAEIKKTVPEGSTLEAELEKSNVTFEDFKSAQLNQMKIEQLIQSKIPEIEPPSDEEVKGYYDSNPKQFSFPASVTFQVLAISQNPNASEEDKKAKLEAAEILRQELIDGASMDEKVAELSEHPSKKNGGKSRIYRGSTGIQELETILFTLKMGNYSDVVVLPTSYIIYKAIESHEAGTTPFEEVNKRIADSMVSRRKQDAVNNYIKVLREKADIEFVGKKTAATDAESTNDKPPAE